MLRPLGLDGGRLLASMSSSFPKEKKKGKVLLVGYINCDCSTAMPNLLNFSANTRKEGVTTKRNVQCLGGLVEEEGYI